VTKKIHKKNTTPAAVIEISDEFEDQASTLFHTYFEDKTNSNPDLLNKAAKLYLKSSNPEAKQIYDLIRAFYFWEQGKKEKNHNKAAILHLKASTIFKKSPKTKTEANKAMLGFYSHKLEAVSSKIRSDAPDIFEKRAKVHKELGNEVEFYLDKGLSHFLRGINPEKILLTELQKSLDYFKKSGKGDFVKKIQATIHNVKAHEAGSIDEALIETKKAISTLEKTSDKFGISIAKGDMSHLMSMIEKDKGKKASLLKEAADYYADSGLIERSEPLLAEYYHYMARSTKPTDEIHAEYYKKAGESYKKIGNNLLANVFFGHYEVAMATEKGVFGDNRDAFSEHLNKANHFYNDAGHSQGVQFTAGIGLFLEAIKLDYPKSTEQLEISAACLDSVGHNYLSNIARAEIAVQKGNNTSDSKKKRLYLSEERNHLDRAILEEEKLEDKTLMEFPLDGKTISNKLLLLLSKARLYELNGFLEDDADMSLGFFKKAKECYLSLGIENTHPRLANISLGWISILLDDPNGARKYFDKLKLTNPDDEIAKKGIEAVHHLIENRYSSLTEDYVLQERVYNPLTIYLSPDQPIKISGKKSPSDFFDLCKVLVNSSCQQLERKRKQFINLGEEALRDQIIMLANFVVEPIHGFSFTGESESGEGSSDIFAINPKIENDVFLSECKIWHGKQEYKKGFKQLVERYRTDWEKASVLINFVQSSTISNAKENAKLAISEIDPDTVFSDTDDLTFVSSHKEYGLVFHRLVDLVPSKE